MDNVKLSDETRSFGPPVGWNQELDGECITISIHDSVDDQSGIPFMTTAWKPSAEELEKLNNGGHIWLRISGHVHPVIQIFGGE